MENGSPTERRNWFPDIEPLFKLLSYENVPPHLKVIVSFLLPYYLQLFYTRGQKLPIFHGLFIFLESSLCSLLQGALRNAIATFVSVSPVHRETIWSFLEQYDLPVVVGPHLRNTAQSVAPVSFSCII